VIQKNWEEYEFDFMGTPHHLKFKILLYLQKYHSFPISEADLYIIFAEDCTYINEQIDQEVVYLQSLINYF
jgi:hypothetical protein